MKTLARLLPLVAATALAISLPAGLRADDAPATPSPADAPKAAAQLSPRVEQRLKFLDEKLKLTDEQKAQITQVFAKAEDQLRSDPAKPEAATRRERRQKFREVMHAAHEQVRGLLTPEQQKVFDTLPAPGRRRTKADSQV